MHQPRNYYLSRQGWNVSEKTQKTQSLQSPQSAEPAQQPRPIEYLSLAVTGLRFRMLRPTESTRLRAQATQLLPANPMF
jgi:membrane-bound lytic murein transglycosylase B